MAQFTKENVLRLLEDIKKDKDFIINTSVLNKSLKEYNHDDIINIIKVLQEIYLDTIKGKGRSYGDSWQNEGEYLSIWGNILRKFHRMKYRMEILYKSKCHLPEELRSLGEEDFNDTLKDMSNYAVMWNAFLILKYIENGSVSIFPSIDGEELETETRTWTIPILTLKGYLNETDNNSIGKILVCNKCKKIFEIDNLMSLRVGTNTALDAMIEWYPLLSAKGKFFIKDHFYCACRKGFTISKG